MSLSLQIALTATPLSLYFYVLAGLQNGRRPRVLPGPLDFTLLVLGVGGLIAFGPFGQAIVARLFGAEPTVLAWTIWVGVLVLWALVLGGSTSRRVVIYNVAPEMVEPAVRDALGDLSGQFVPTVHGYEDAQRHQGVHIQLNPGLRVATIEAFGNDPEVFMSELRPHLRARFRDIPCTSAAVSGAFYALSTLTMLLPLMAFLWVDPRAANALKSVFQKMWRG